MPRCDNCDSVSQSRRLDVLRKFKNLHNFSNATVNAQIKRQHEKFMICKKCHVALDRKVLNILKQLPDVPPPKKCRTCKRINDLREQLRLSNLTPSQIRNFANECAACVGACHTAHKHPFCKKAKLTYLSLASIYDRMKKNRI